MDENRLKECLKASLKTLGVVCAGQIGDYRRWSGTDLATDLAPVLFEIISKTLNEHLYANELDDCLKLLNRPGFETYHTDNRLEVAKNIHALITRQFTALVGLTVACAQRAIEFPDGSPMDVTLRDISKIAWVGLGEPSSDKTAAMVKQFLALRNEMIMAMMKKEG